MGRESTSLTLSESSIRTTAPKPTWRARIQWVWVWHWPDSWPESWVATWSTGAGQVGPGSSSPSPPPWRTPGCSPSPPDLLDEQLDIGLCRIVEEGSGPGDL